MKSSHMLVCCMVLLTTMAWAGANDVKVTNGIFVRQTPIYSGETNNFDFYVDLTNKASSTTIYDDVCVAVHKTNGDWIQDLKCLGRKAFSTGQTVRIGEGEQYTLTSSIVAGNYQIRVNLQYAGAWQLASLGSGGLNNPGGFTVVNRPYTYSWYSDAWSSCSVTCGTGQQARASYCKRNDGVQVADSYCSGAGTKPATSQSCTVSCVCTSFTYSDWGTCGSGTQIRTVLSSSPSGCTGGNPVTSQTCIVAPSCDSAHHSLCTTSASCSSANGYWYGGVCNDTSQTLVPTCTLSANPSGINQGEGSTLTWSTQNSPTTASISGLGTVSANSGSITVYPGSTTAYTLTVLNSAGNNTCNATVTVNSATLPPIPTLPTEFIVTASAGSNGSVQCTSPVTSGDSTTCTVTPATGYQIASVTGCGGTLTGTIFTTGTITGACTVSASFSAATTAPGAPINVSATVGNTQATVSFTAPTSNGGNAITGYTVTSSPGNKTASGTASPITVTGLTNGTAYTFTVTATNAAGAGPTSATSASVTPTNTTACGARHWTQLPGGTSPTVMHLAGNLTINGRAANSCDEIAAYDSTGTLVGYFYVQNNGQYGDMVIYGDSSATTTIDEGATSGEKLTVRVWDGAAQQEYSTPSVLQMTPQQNVSGYVNYQGGRSPLPLAA